MSYNQSINKTIDRTESSDTHLSDESVTTLAICLVLFE